MDEIEIFRLRQIAETWTEVSLRSCAFCAVGFWEINPSASVSHSVLPYGPTLIFRQLSLLEKLRLEYPTRVLFGLAFRR
jgi:hypothetical protein